VIGCWLGLVKDVIDADAALTVCSGVTESVAIPSAFELAWVCCPDALCWPALREDFSATETGGVFESSGAEN